MRFFGIVVCLIALALTGYSAIVYNAPIIQADIQARVKEAVSRVATEPVDITVDGRRVTLRGTVSDDRERERLLRVAGEVRGGLGPIDGLERLTVMAPYRFEAAKDQGGNTVIEGFAPNAELRDLMKADAKAIFGKRAEVRIDLAAGAPAGDWRSITGLGMDALATLDHGKMVITDNDLLLVGKNASPNDIEAIDIFSDAAPEGFFWTNELSTPDQAIPQVETVEPFTLTVLKSADGSLNIKGFAPDEATRRTMIDQAKAVASDRPVIADIQIADGMPDAGWPELVFTGIGAMSQVEAGKYEVVGNDVSFDGDIKEDADPGPFKTIAVQAPDRGDLATSTDVSATEETDNAADRPPTVSPYVMTVYKTDDGALRLQGVTPDAAVRDELLVALRENMGIDEIEADIEFAEGMPGDDWQDFIIDRSTALKAVKSGSLSFADYGSHLIGVVETPEDIDLVQTKLAAIDSAMTTDLNPIDSRSAAALDLVISSDKGITLWGSLPNGLTEKEAANTLGLHEYMGGLNEDGRGNADVWRKNLLAIGGYLPQFEHVGITISDDRARIKGKLYTNSDVDQVTNGLTALFHNDQTTTIDVSTTELVYEDGTKRNNPLTGGEEVYDRGYWLPVVSFSAELGECRKQSTDILASNKITFLRGAAALDARAQKIVDRLAAVAIKCLENDKLALRIGGHTDSRGAKDMNDTLSRSRADAVLRSLTARGVGAASIIATGYGETQPIANNKTEGGRARNRRITFEWKESGPEG